MTNQHRATPEQWKDVEEFLSTLPYPSTASCLLELRDRLAAAEQRIQALEAAENYRQQDEDVDRAMEPAPAGGLVERVANAITDDPADVHLWHDDARAAIHAVAAWFDAIGYGATASILRQEVQRHG